MDIRYQVFVSSTYNDLKEERQQVIQALLELDCIPAGMELFPAANEDQWSLIKRVINDCDYYVVIVAGRYGSIGPDGTSYTEMEYRYALEKGIPVLGFIRKDPDNLPADLREPSHDANEKLSQFRELMKQKLCKFWDSPGDLGGQVSRSLIKLMNAAPAVGWVRADKMPTEQLLAEMNELRKSRDELQQELNRLNAYVPPNLKDLAGLDDEITINATVKSTKYPDKHFNKSITWRELFGLIAPHLLDHPNDASVQRLFSSTFFNYAPIDDQDYQTVKIHLTALQLVTVDYLQTTQGGYGLFWSLTPKGHALMMETRTVRKTKAV